MKSFQEYVQLWLDEPMFAQMKTSSQQDRLFKQKLMGLRAQLQSEIQFINYLNAQAICPMHWLLSQGYYKSVLFICDTISEYEGAHLLARLIEKGSFAAASKFMETLNDFEDHKRHIANNKVRLFKSLLEQASPKNFRHPVYLQLFILFLNNNVIDFHTLEHHDIHHLLKNEIERTTLDVERKIQKLQTVFHFQKEALHLLGLIGQKKRISQPLQAQVNQTILPLESAAKLKTESEKVIQALESERDRSLSPSLRDHKALLFSLHNTVKELSIKQGVDCCQRWEERNRKIKILKTLR